MLNLARAAMLLLALVVASPADAASSVTGDFTILYGSPSASGGTVTFVLNGDGTIAASLASTSGAIDGFGFDSGNAGIVESGFSPTQPANAAGWGDFYGSHDSGFACTSCGTSETWTIGTPGQFTDVFQAISGSGSQYDFFFFANGQQWAANAQVTAGVPEPATWAMMLLGFGGIGLSMRRRKHKSAQLV